MTTQVLSRQVKKSTHPLTDKTPCTLFTGSPDPFTGLKPLPSGQMLILLPGAQAAFQRLSWLKDRAERPVTSSGSQRLMQTEGLKQD